MRVMVIVKASKASEAGVMPGTKLLTEMGAFNERLAAAGLLLAGEGLHPSGKGVRVRFGAGGPKIVPGPFPEAESLVAGFWLWRVASMEEAVDWAERMPQEPGLEQEIEIRRVFEAEDFGAELTPDLREREDRLRDLLGSA